MTLYTYLPQDRIRALAMGESLPDRANGAALFADISGFTLLTESMRDALGPRRGAEELASHLDEVYKALINQIEQFGGSVIDFAGDAVMCWFDDLHGSAVPRATACAFALQQSMQAFRVVALSGGQVGSLSIKVAVAAGAARRFVVGNPEVNYMDTLAGATIMRTSRAENLAQKGEILLDEFTVNNLGATLTISEWRLDPESGERYAVAESFSGSDLSIVQFPLSEVDDKHLQGWINHTVYEREVSGLVTFLTEFRPCVAMFVRFIGIDFDSDAANGQLDTLVRQIQIVATQFGGTLLQIIIGDKGSYAYINFGGLNAHEDDEHRAVKAALLLLETTQVWSFLEPLQVGISYGVMRTGSYGAPTRRTYGAIGDVVNLAARLMQTAKPGEILVSAHVYKAASDDFVFEPHPPVVAKGKSEPFTTFAVTGERQQRAIRLQEPQYALPMVGRQAELQIANDKLDLALDGQAQIIAILAEAGMGKSRLVAEVIRSAHRKGFIGFGGACQSDAVNIPYHGWKPIWNAFFDIDPDVPFRKQIRLLEGDVEDLAPERIESLPLLGEMLGIDIPENDFTKVLEPKDRKGALSALLEDCLRSSAEDAPILIVMEDLHWIDSLSHDLLEEVTRATTNSPICFVLAYRPPQLQRLQVARIESLPQFTRIELSELSENECRQAVQAKLAQLYPARSGAVPPVLFDKLMERAQGNPFYLEELLNFLRDRGLDPLNPADLEKIELPDSLHSLILSRIDQLSEHERTTLRVASIIGRQFRARWLTGYYPSLGDLPEVKADLKELESLDITPLDTPEPELAYLFKHIVTHEVTYESLPFAIRAQMHEQLAQYLEATYPNALPVEILAYHYGLTENTPKKREYLCKSAEAAYRVYANEVALEYYEKALQLSPEPDEMVEIHLMSGTILQVIGEWEKALSHLKNAYEIANRQQLTQKIVESQVKIATWLDRRGEYDQALDWLNKAHELAQRKNDLPGECDVLSELGTIYWRLGQFENALEYSQQARELARQLNDKKREAVALFFLATIHSERGAYTEGHKYFEATYNIDMELNDKRHLSSTLLNWGTTYYYEGDYETAKKLIEQSLFSCREIGEKRGSVISLNNLGNIFYLDNDYQAARKYYLEALSQARSLSDRYMMSISSASLGITAFQEGDLEEAEECYRQSMEFSLALDHKVSLSLIHCYQGLLALARVQTDSAWDSFRAGLKIAHESDIKVYSIYNLIGCACAYMADGNSLSAAVLLGAVSANAESIGLKIEPELQQPYEKTLQRAKESLSGEEFESAWNMGEKMNLDEAVAYALRVT